MALRFINQTSLWDYGPPTSMEGGGTVVWASSLGLFVAAGGQATSGAGAAIATSPDAINWTERTVPGAPYTSGVKFSMGNICWAPEISTLVLIGADGHNDAFGDPVLSSQTNQVWTSPDGINWTARGRIFSGNYGPTRSIAWSPSLGLFVVGSAAGSSNNPILISTSPDGITWSNGATPWDSISGDFVSVTDIAWSPDLSLFAATGHCSFSGLSSDILTSSDAITWTQRHSGHLSATNIEWVPFLNEFLYQGAQAGSPPAIFSTSPDGTTWTDTTAPFNFITDGIWPFADTYLVSVSGDIYASSNGTTWSAHDSTAHGIQASKGAWSADLDLGVSLCQTSTPPNNIAICVSAPNPVTGIMDPHNIAHGTLASNTLTEDVEWYFQWGTSSGTVSSNSTTPETQGPGFSQVPVSIEIPGLDLGTTYYYRLVGTHRGITAYGATLSFTATAPVAPPLDTTDGKHAYYHNGEWHIVRDKV